MVTAIFLAGGFGTRLKHIVPDVPKALAPICNVPFLKLLLKKMEESGIISQAVFALGFGAEQIERFLAEQRCSFPIEISKEETPLGTGGALLLANLKAKEKTLLILNADTWIDLSFSQFLESHKKHRADVTIACRAVPDTSRYGSVEVKDNQIVSFREKVPGSGLISTGFYLMQKALFENLQLAPCSLEKELLPNFLSKRLFAFSYEGIFIDIGTPASYTEAQTLLRPWILK